jgi:hypothetical protein
MAAARGAALMAALPGTAPRQRAKRSDEESLLPPNRGQAWHETDLTGGSSSRVGWHQRCACGGRRTRRRLLRPHGGQQLEEDSCSVEGLGRKRAEARVT